LLLEDEEVLLKTD
jgi:hypothetical protein